MGIPSWLLPRNRLRVSHQGEENGNNTVCVVTVGVCHESRELLMQSALAGATIPTVCGLVAVCWQKRVCALLESLSVVFRLAITTLLWASFYEVRRR